MSLAVEDLGKAGRWAKGGQNSDEWMDEGKEGRVDWREGVAICLCSCPDLDWNRAPKMGIDWGGCVVGGKRK
jgi:hypothetical protein